MTVTQVAALRAKWKQRVDPRSCAHLNLELEGNDDAYLTGNHHCIECGESVAKKL
jgi:hypothetical protein